MVLGCNKSTREVALVKNKSQDNGDLFYFILFSPSFIASNPKFHPDKFAFYIIPPVTKAGVPSKK